MTTHLRSKRIKDRVKDLHDQDEALSKTRVKTKVEQRVVRMTVGALCATLDEAELKEVADYSGYSEARLRDFVLVRKAWPEGTFPDDVSYTPLEELARDPERFSKIKSGMSKRDARAAKGGKVDTPSRWSAQTKADFIKEALADPEVARAAAMDQSTRAAMAEAEWKHREDRREQRRINQPGLAAQEANTELAELVRSVENIRYATMRAVDKAIALNAAGDASLIEVVREAKNAIEWLESYATGGSTTFESELRILLGGN